MEADLMNLRPAVGELNADRSDNPFGTVEVHPVPRRFGGTVRPLQRPPGVEQPRERSRPFGNHPGPCTLAAQDQRGGGDSTEEKEAEYEAALAEALKAGEDVLKAGGTSLDAITAAIIVMEDSPLFNAGKGAVFTSDGKAFRSGHPRRLLDTLAILGKEQDPIHAIEELVGTGQFDQDTADLLGSVTGLFSDPESRPDPRPPPSGRPHPPYSRATWRSSWDRRPPERE